MSPHLPTPTTVNPILTSFSTHHTLIPLSSTPLSTSLHVMATTSLQSSLQCHHHPSAFTTPDSSSSSLFLKATAHHKLFSSLSTSSSSSPLVTPTTTATPPDALEAIASSLSAADFRRADEETRRLLVDLAGDAAQRRGYVFFSEVRFIPAADLQAVDRLWRRHSGGRFGYSVQRRLWDKARRDFTRFFIGVGWMKRLDATEVEQYTYRSFPAEFMWELKDDTPEGHLPLTNALRGTQLLASILTHPAFEDATTLVDESEQGDEKKTSAEKKGSSVGPKPMASKRLLKPDYSF